MRVRSIASGPWRAFLFLLLIFCVAAPASAQECPRINPAGPDIPSRVRTLEGTLVYHNGIRQWFELKLDKPRCGERAIQLVQTADHPKQLEIFRGCRVRSTGPLGDSGTGYFSLDLYEDVKRLVPVGHCIRRSPFPDYSKLRPDKRVRAYTVWMEFDYRPGDHPVTFRVRSAGRELRPWQVYADYLLTGGYVLYGTCGHGFVVDRVFGTRAAQSTFGDPHGSGDMAMFDPEGAAAKGKRLLHLGYTCIREAAS